MGRLRVQLVQPVQLVRPVQLVVSHLGQGWPKYETVPVELVRLVRAVVRVQMVTFPFPLSFEYCITRYCVYLSA